MPHPDPAAEALRGLPAGPGLAMMPCRFDALSARLIQQAGFDPTVLSGFGPGRPAGSARPIRA